MCVDCWLGDRIESSPAVSEFDPLEPAIGTPPVTPRSISVDLSRRFNQSVTKTLYHWIRDVDHLELSLPWPPPNPSFSRLMTQVQKRAREEMPGGLLQ